MKPIVLGDTNMIVTETDSLYLANYIADISPSSKKNAADELRKTMVQIDSVNDTKELEKKVNEKTVLAGYTINFDGFNVVFENIEAHAIQKTQNPKSDNSVSYIMDHGELFDLMIQVSNDVQQVSIEERLKIKLSVEKDGERLLLNSLGMETTPWYNLAGKDNIFVSVGTNSVQFKEVSHAQIEQAVVAVLKSKNKKDTDIKRWKQALANTKAYNDVPCKIKVWSGQWRIKGIDKNGKKVNKLIQFDDIK
ncbi:MAG: hypothetical protein R2831_03775 [Chitinophagaceae bacterium]